MVSWELRYRRIACCGCTAHAMEVLQPGTGFDKVSAADLRERLQPLVRKTQAFAKRIAHKGIWPRFSTARNRLTERSGTRSSRVCGRICDAMVGPLPQGRWV